MERLAVVVSIFIFSVLTIFSCETKKEMTEEKEEHGDVELGEAMFYNQRYMEKLYLAGINKNWELSKFYHHELEENMEKIIEGNVQDEGKDISALTKQIFLPTLKEMGTVINAKDSVEFLKTYNLMVTSCNSCHAASNHNFIKITVPVSPHISNQEF